MNIISFCLGFLCIGSFMYLLALFKYARYSPIESVGFCILLFVFVFTILKFSEHYMYSLTDLRMNEIIRCFNAGHYSLIQKSKKDVNTRVTYITGVCGA